jgi:hypothetical protein
VGCWLWFWMFGEEENFPMNRRSADFRRMECADASDDPVKGLICGGARGPGWAAPCDPPDPALVPAIGDYGNPALSLHLPHPLPEILPPASSHGVRGVAQAQKPPPHERAARTSIGRTQQRPCAAQAPHRGATCAALLAPRSGWARGEPNRGGRDCSWVPEACRQWGAWTRPSRSCPRTDYTLQILPTRLQATPWRYAPDLS